MKMTGEERIAAPRSRVWEALNDSEILRHCIPGCQSLERESAQRLRAMVEVKIGPIGVRFNSLVTLSDVDPLQGYTLISEGQGGTAGSAKSIIKVRIGENGAGTLLSYEVDAQVGGRLAQLGGPLIDATAKQLATKFFTRFRELITPAAEGRQTEAAREEPRTLSADARPASASPAAPTVSGSFPIAWVLALVVAALVGFLVGRGQGSGSDWMGLAIGLLVIVVAAAGFELGRRTAAPQIVIDPVLLVRLLRGDKR